MTDQEKLQRVLQTLGDGNRLRIINFIGKEEKSVSAVTEEIELSQPLVSHHLKALKTNGILETRRDGPFVLYKLADARLLDILGSLLEIFRDTEISEEETDIFFPPPMWWKKLWKN